MKIKDILYIGAALLTACSAEENINNPQTVQSNRLPLRFEATLNTTGLATRAAGKDFAENDQLLAYIRHTTGGTLGSYTITPAENPGKADKAPLLVTFTKGSATMVFENETTNKTSDLTPASPLYWDDFSDSRNAATDLHTSGHGLQTYYGYCYNGGTPSTPLTETTGVLGWSVGTITTGIVNQNSATAIQHADLLWSAEQVTMSYAHSTSREEGNHGTLVIPYTHAMSQVTVELVAGEGFSTEADPLASSTLTLNSMNTVVSLTAPDATFTGSGSPANITMYGTDSYKKESEENYRRKFTAIVAPGTKLKEGVKLLDITNVDDNHYTLNITGTAAGEMLHAEAWQSGHTLGTDDGNYILTKPGINYYLTVTVNKTRIDVEAQLTDWTDVNAAGTAVIDFPEVSFSLTGDNLDNNSVIKVFQLKYDASNADESERTNAAVNRTNSKYGTPATTATFNGSLWTYSPDIYWPNNTDKFYFRAMTQATDEVGQGTVAEKDVLWATTPTHGETLNTYAEGAAIGPRKNEVPLQFKHVMSKITFNLETTNDATITVNNAKVDLNNAIISISNLSTTGTISIEDGIITPGAITSDAIPAGDGAVAASGGQTATTSISNLIVVPQTITDDAVVTITLRDGENNVVANYTLQLNLCKDDTDTAIGVWEQGKNYSYTIHLEKEQIQFRTLIKDWVEKAGSGDATLEWD